MTLHRFLPWILLLAALLAYLLLPATAYSYAPSSYVHARYGQNLLDGAGLGFNPGERVLLSPALLPILAQALEGLPTGELPQPARLLPLLLLAGALWALYRLSEKLGLSPAWALLAGAVLLLGLWGQFGGAGWWLACLSLLTLEALNRHPAAVVVDAPPDPQVLPAPASGLWRRLREGLSLLDFYLALLLLVTPLALSFWLLLGALRRLSLLALLPALLWWGAALAYFGRAGLEGLTLPQAADIAPLPLLLLLGLATLGVGWQVLRRMEILPLLLAGVLWAALYSLLHFPGQSGLAVLLLVLLLLERPAWWFGGLAVLAVCASSLLLWDPLTALQPFPGSVGFYGDEERAFALGGQVIELQGAFDPALRELSAQERLLYTAPDYLLLPPEDALLQSTSFAALDYRPLPRANAWQRQLALGEWGALQSLAQGFGPDVQLVAVQQDRREAGAGSWLRLRLDWELARLPEQAIGVQVEALDINQQAIASAEHSIPAEDWQPRRSSYHLLHLAEDAPAGRYDLRVTLHYNAALLGRAVVSALKVPLVPPPDVPAAALVSFTGADGAVSLLRADWRIERDALLLKLLWRADAGFNADYRVFLHLTPADEVQPLAQADSPPRENRYPTSIWAAGEVIPDTMRVAIAGLPPGTYALRIGLYHPERGRLTTPQGDSYTIAVFDLP